MLIVPPSSGGEQFLATTFIDQPGGEVTFRDPMSGEDLATNVVPDVLRNWPVLKEGFDFLEQEGHRVDFSLLLAPHSEGADLARAGVDIRAEAERVHERRGILFLEAVHDAGEQGSLVRLYNEAAQGQGDLDRYSSVVGEDQSTFPGDVLKLIYGTNARVEIADIRRREAVQDMDLLGPVHAMLDQWSATSEQIKALPTTLETSKNLLVAEVGYQNYREWMILGIVGAKLSRFRDRYPLDAPITGTLLMGSGHLHMAEKAQALVGHPIRIVGEQSTFRHDRYVHNVMRGLGNTALSTADIHDYQAFRAGLGGSGYFQT